MRVSVRRSLPALFLLGMGLATLSCSSNGTGPSGNAVSVENNSFNPSSLTVGTGTTVTWQWNSGTTQHNVTWVTTSGTGNSPTQASGTYTRTFDTPGTYDYYCTIHGTATTGMHGSIVVQ